jgi:ATP-dependent RNA helicase SUPV3L1/SUV3
MNHQPRILAVLGPTNTGKTHFAMDRLLAHRSGIIGFPLRLLARENYERAVAAKGAGKVALITGEEKIVPSGAQYFICTVESMPLDRPVAFLAVDEIQMCADPERGHIFTARLLHARGTDETLFLGAETIRPLIRQLVPEATFDKRPRFSTLSYAGERKINRLAPQSAIVAFSATDVYAIAEQVRRHRGGAAVVMGALSPRTRNAQVAMYQAGEVDILVATDAIGMGLNMDVDHVAFAATRKFDGKRARPLSAPEIGQIAGRAGRHMNDGTFGVTAEARALDSQMIDDVEQHRFRPIKLIYWRNPQPDMASLAALQSSLAMPPELPGLIRAGGADDETALALLAGDTDIAAMAKDTQAVELLWEVCQIPDFRKVMSDAHASLLGRIYSHLMAGKLPTDWFADHVQRIDRTDGNIETLTGRLANIRTWTYIAHRSDWLDDAPHWQEQTRALEDRLSDALHETLTRRFVDQRTAVLVKGLRDPAAMLATVKRDGTVLVEGHEIGRLEGFCFIAQGQDKSILQAARHALGPEFENRIQALQKAPDGKITLNEQGAILFAGGEIARLKAGAEIHRPDIKLLVSELLDASARARIEKRLTAWLSAHLKQLLNPLTEAQKAELNGAARGIVFQLAENMGSLPRRGLEKQITALKREERKSLRAIGVVIGRASVYFPALLKAAPMSLLSLLWNVSNPQDTPPAIPHPGRVSLPTGDFPVAFLAAIGYRPAGRLALRLDILERVAGHAWNMGRKGPFAIDAPIQSLAGCGTDDMCAILAELGFQQRGNLFSIKKAARAKSKGKSKPLRKVHYDPHSPFAKLKELALPP